MPRNPNQAWRTHVGFVAWPTLALAFAAWAIWAAVVVEHARGHLPSWAAVLVNTLAIYALFTPMHEAAHGNVGGAPSRDWVDRAVGWACAAPMMTTFPAFRYLHLQHHAKTNDPEADPDFHVAGSFWRALPRAFTTIPHYEWFFWTRLPAHSPGAERHRPAMAAFYVVLTLLLVGTAWAGFGGTILWAMLVPGLLGTALLAMVFDWLPHHPHTARGRFVDTRALPSRTLDVVLLGQNLHLIHHLWPRVPFYRYAAVYQATRPLLQERGALIGPTARMR